MKSPKDNYQKTPSRFDESIESLKELEIGYIERIIELESALRGCIQLVRGEHQNIASLAADMAEEILNRPLTPKPASAGSVTGD